MTHIITSLCMSEEICVEVCPVESIVPGKPKTEWPWTFIDADTCIDCGACLLECPYGAIFPEDQVPNAYIMQVNQERIQFGTKSKVRYEGGEVVDLTIDIRYNYMFFSEGPGWEAWEQ